MDSTAADEAAAVVVVAEAAEVVAKERVVEVDNASRCCSAVLLVASFLGIDAPIRLLLLQIILSSLSLLAAAPTDRAAAALRVADL